MIKIKPLTKQQLLISLDRLTRFKHPETKYLRVFKELILSNLILPKFKKSELEKLPYSEIRDYAQNIINSSLDNLDLQEDYSINKALLDYENRLFKCDKNTLELLNNKINYKRCLEFIDDSSCQNLRWLKHLDKPKIDDRENFSLKFPVEKVVICEGITEEILLPEFAKLCDYDFDKKGVFMLSAGGKNQVVKLFYQLSETLKIPIFVLLDNDAQKNYLEIKPKLRNFDEIYVLKSGEFEDVLPISLIKKALKYGLNNISVLDDDLVKSDLPMTKILEEIFRHRGMHEFKKSEFAHMVCNCINSADDISAEIRDIIERIKNLNL